MDYEKKIELLHALVDSADIEDAKNEYGAKKDLPIDGSISTALIRELFGWNLSEAAKDTRHLTEVAYG